MLLGFLFCKEALERLDDYLDHELSPQDQQRVTTHLKICAHCAQMYHFERGLIEDIRTKAVQVQTPSELMKQISRSLSALEES